MLQLKTISKIDFILYVGFSMFIHGPCTISFADNTTGYEGRFESAPQLILQLVLFMKYKNCFFKSWQGISNPQFKTRGIFMEDHIP